MKTKIIIIVMLAAALQVSAQTNNRGRTSREPANTSKKTESTEQVRKEESSEKKVITRERINSNRDVNAPGSRSQPVLKETPGTSSSKQRRTTTINSASQESNSNVSRRPAEQRNANTEVKRDRRDSYNRGSVPQPGRTPANTSREREVNTRSTQSTVNRSAQSVRGNEYKPKTGREYEQARRVYETPARRTVVRKTYVNPGYVYKPIDYRRIHNPYRAPVRVELHWSVPMYREYRHLYPEFNYWYYPIGYSIHTISAYDAVFYFGEIARIYR